MSLFIRCAEHHPPGEALRHAGSAYEIRRAGHAAAPTFRIELCPVPEVLICPLGQGGDGFSQGRHGTEGLVMAVSGGAYFNEQCPRGQVLVIPLVRKVQFPAQSGTFLLQNRL